MQLLRELKKAESGERLREKPEDLLVGKTGFQSESKGQEGEMDNNSERDAKGDMQAHCDTEDTFLSTSTGPSCL